MSRRTRWLLGIAAGVLLLLGALLLAGSALLLRQWPGLQGLQGSVWTGLQADQLGGEVGGLRWQASGLVLQPLRWREGRLQTGLQLRRLSLSLPPDDGSPPPTAEQLLARLNTPLGLRLLPLQIDQLEFNGQRLDALQAARVELGGAQHRIDALRLQEPRSGIRLQADAQLGGDGRLQLRAQAQRGTLVLRADGVGSLSELPLTLQLHDGPTEQLQAHARLRPLAATTAERLRSLDARFSALNPQALHPQAPRGAWSGQLQLGPGAQLPLALRLQASNAAAARLDEGGWPLRALQAALQLDPARWQALQLSQLELSLGGSGREAGRLQLRPQQGLPQAGQPLDSLLRLQQLQLRELDARWPQALLDGELGLRQQALNLEAPLDWRLRLQASLPAPLATWLAEGEGQLHGRRLQLGGLLLRQGAASARLSGDAELLPRGWRSEGQLALDGLSLPLPPWPSPSQLHGEAQWQLREDALGRQLGQLRLSLQDGNRLAGLPLQGALSWQGEVGGQQWSVALQGSDGLRLDARGSLDQALRARAGWPPALAWLPQQATWSIPQLRTLQALWQPWLRQLSGRSEGRWRAAPGSAWPEQAEILLSELQLQADAGDPVLRLDRLQGRLADGAGTLTLQALAHGDWRLERLSAEGGRDQAWRLSASALSTRDDSRRWQLQGSSAAPLLNAGDWRWPALQLQLQRSDQTLPLLQLRDALLQAEPPSRLRLSGGSLLVAGEALALQQASWQRDGPWVLALTGRPRLAAWLRQLDPRAQAWSGDAALDLRLNASSDGDGGSPHPQLALELSGLQGELRLDDKALGLQALQLLLRQQADGQGQLALAARSTLFGQLDAQLSQSAAGSLGGQLRAALPQLAALRPWLPVGLQLEGAASLDASVSGSRQAPRLRGNLALQLQRLLHPSSGFATQQGELLAEFDEDRLRLRTLRLQGQAVDGGDGGQLRGSGELHWGGESPVAELQLEAERFRALNRFDRRLVASGALRLKLATPQRQLQLKGQLSADEGFYEIGSPDAPVLDSDVVQVGQDEPAERTRGTSSRWQRDVDLQLDLGQRLRVQGRGFASRLTGQLRLQEQGSQGLRATGRIETQGGRYKAYGQVLDLESGEIRFTGSLDNPRLDLLAIKPDIEHRVGVSVTGSAQAPRVRLYAEPELPDNDKLAWLLLGRDPAEVSGKDAALLQRAALALLSGEGSNPAAELLDKLGLTEFSVSQGEDASTVLRLGAQLSRRWSVGYERSLNATTGSWQLVYRLGQRFRLRAQSGLDSAVDLLWLWRFD